MNEKVLKKRAWIKNAIIIFLAVMLLLTFFSNTILNYSLPEVAAHLRSIASEGDIILTVGAGDIYKAGEMLLK